MDSITSVLKNINKKFNDSIMTVGVNKGDREKFSLGSPSADFMTLQFDSGRCMDRGIRAGRKREVTSCFSYGS